jgi:hypothetical protein
VLRGHREQVVVTIYLADYAVYQAGLTLAQLKAAGYTIANFKTSHGLGQKSVAANLPGLLAEARRLGLGVCTFHWLDKSASGGAQADYAFDRLTALGLKGTGFGHVCDCESDATEKIFRDYMARMQQRLGRKIALYTGDWWWTDPDRKWNGSGLTPYLHAAPNAGYLPAYPGDTSAHWKAGYGGWPNLSIMQHRVAKVAGVAVSQSAIRDPAVWQALTGGEDDVSQADVLAALKSAEGRAAIYSAVMEQDKIQRYDVNGVAVPQDPKDAGAHTMWPASAIQYLGKDSALIKKSLGVAEGQRAAGATQLKEALDAAQADRAEAADQLAAIADLLRSAGGDPNLAPVIDQITALQERLASGGRALKGGT